MGRTEEHASPLRAQASSTTLRSEADHGEATAQEGQNETCVRAPNWRQGRPDSTDTEEPVATGRGVALVQILPAAAPGTSRLRSPELGETPKGPCGLLFPLFNIDGCPFFFVF